MAASTNFGDRNDTENGDDHELESLAVPDAMSNAQQPPPPAPTLDRIIKAFNDEITESIKNNFSQLFMTATSEMYVVMTTTEDGAMYYIPHVLNGFIMINVIILLVLILFRKWAFKTKDGQCLEKTKKKARTLQKVYRWLSILLIVFQFLFMIVTGVSVMRSHEGGPQNDTSTVTMATNTIGKYVVNTTSG